MISYIDWGSILEDPAATMVVPVCCVPGVMGAGLAKQFADRWPGLVAEHHKARESGHLQPGSGYWLSGKVLGDCPKNFILAATKDHYRDPSRIEWVRGCLSALAAQVLVGTPYQLTKTYALPALGCGLGGLAWSDVKPLVDQYLGRTEKDGWGTEWRVYLPQA